MYPAYIQTTGYSHQSMPFSNFRYNSAKYYNRKYGLTIEESAHGTGNLTGILAERVERGLGN